jgi:AAA domain
VTIETPDVSLALSAGPKALQQWSVSGLQRVGTSLVQAKSQQAGSHSAPKTLHGMRVLGFLAKTFPPIQERIEKLAPLEGFGVFVGADKSGKSLSLTQLGICLASGKPWMDATVEQCPVIVVEEEGAEHSLQSRLDRQIRHYGLAGQDLPLHVYHRTMLKLQDGGWIDELEKEVNRTGAQVVLISSLAQVGGIEDENDQKEFNAIHDAMRQLIDRTHVLVIIAHHRRKPAKESPPGSVDAFFNTSRGSTALMAAVDVAFGLLRGSEEPTGRMFYKGRDFPSRSWRIAFDKTSLTFDVDWSAMATKPAMEKANILAVLELNRGTRMTLADIEAKTALPRTTIDRRVSELVAEGHALSGRRGSGPRAAHEYWVDVPASPSSVAAAAAVTP